MKKPALSASACVLLMTVLALAGLASWSDPSADRPVAAGGQATK